MNGRISDTQSDIFVFIICLFTDYLIVTNSD